MTPWLKKIHRWLGLLIGLQLVVWMLSGLMMSLFDSDVVKGKPFRAPAPAIVAWPADTLPISQLLHQLNLSAGNVSSAWLLDEPIYKLSVGKEQRLYSARDGRQLHIDAALAQRIAISSYRGPGQAGQAELVPRSLETRAHEGMVWRVPFSDAEDTTVYLREDGTVLVHRNATWRLFDIFWMLHIMDYVGRADFNNALVVTMAIGGLWLALSGTWLLFTSFRLADFVPAGLRGKRSFQILGADGSRLRTLKAGSGETAFVAMARQGLQLPSNCGGGQSCSLCEVRVRGVAPPATASDRAMLSPAKIRDGYRLACNLPVTEGLELEIPGGAEALSPQRAKVEKVSALTPSLREIVLRPDERVGSAYRPGSYIQVQVPAYRATPKMLDTADELSAVSKAYRLPESWSNESTVRRAYSLSSPVELTDGRISLLVRFMPAPVGAAHHPPGKGSSYMHLLKPGDTVHYSGPFGDFALQSGGREKVFIGGGAGMAPLRAMLQSLLAGGAKERLHFWYGARTVAEAPYVGEMEALAARHANFHWKLVSSEEGQGGAGNAGKLVHLAAREELLALGLDLGACDFYLCGPPAMLSATRKMLRELGVKDGQVAFDDFKI
ncbi:MAG: 2Fe-2S iron-sulfur cluster binding domain-containing protein [Burkholderiales bacterium]|nr:2Fe-2S iron-sulfur cluster binding domain-containing protein [Burkholderiales bacterium]